MSNFPMEMELFLEPSTLVVAMKGIKCKSTGNPMTISVRRRLLRADSEREAVRFIYWCVQEAVLHEVAETFRYMHKIAFDPHKGRPETELAQVIPPEADWNSRGVPY